MGASVVTRFFRRVGLLIVDAALGTWLTAPIIGIALLLGVEVRRIIALWLASAAVTIVGLQALSTADARRGLFVALMLISIAGGVIDTLLSVIRHNFVGIGRDLAIFTTLLLALYMAWVAIVRLKEWKS